MSHSDNPKKHQKDGISEEFLNYEFPAISYGEVSSFRPPPVPGGLFPPNIPDTSFPPFAPHTGGGYAPPSGTEGMPGGPPSTPPNYVPKKNENGTQSYNGGGDSGPSAKSVSSTSIKICLYKYTYIWETNGRSYWTYLTYIDRRSVSGYKWLGRTWALFGLDLRRIDSFICYRDNTLEENNRAPQEKLTSIKKEFSLSGTREIYSTTLASVSISESKEDALVNKIGVVEDKSILSTVPCMKSRNINYRICIEVSYPEALDAEIKSTVNLLTNEACEEALTSLNKKNLRHSNLSPFESFDNSLSCISYALESFSKKFTRGLNTLTTNNNISNDISYKIVYEKIPTNWSVIY